MRLLSLLLGNFGRHLPRRAGSLKSLNSVDCVHLLLQSQKKGIKWVLPVPNHIGPSLLGITKSYHSFPLRSRFPPPTTLLFPPLPVNITTLRAPPSVDHWTVPAPAQRPQTLHYSPSTAAGTVLSSLLHSLPGSFTVASTIPLVPGVFASTHPLIPLISSTHPLFLRRRRIVALSHSHPGTTTPADSPIAICITRTALSKEARLPRASTSSIICPSWTATDARQTLLHHRCRQHQPLARLALLSRLCARLIPTAQRHP